MPTSVFKLFFVDPKEAKLFENGWSPESFWGALAVRKTIWNCPCHVLLGKKEYKKPKKTKTMEIELINFLFLLKKFKIILKSISSKELGLESLFFVYSKFGSI